MSKISAILDKLAMNSPPEVFKGVVNTLMKIGQNIIAHPNNAKYRFLPKHNQLIRQKLLALDVGAECLTLMGFVENDKGFIMPATFPVAIVKQFCDLIQLKKVQLSGPNVEQMLRQNQISVDKKPNDDNDMEEIKNCKQIVLPPLKYLFTDPFLKDIERFFHNALIYADNNLRQFAKQFIPIKQLEFEAATNLRQVQEEIKRKQRNNNITNKTNYPDYTMQDMLIVALLAWFKNDFFNWIDTPDCEQCGTKTVMSHMSQDTKDDWIYTNRIEIHRCPACNNLTKFPRYNDPTILLYTRKGRCGEWANVFTLFCNALGWDTRIVHDSTDHVWTEVYSYGQKRWLHCDPCENCIDRPLIYENGWGKQLSYVFAYGIDDLQDVTWRYSSKHADVLTRRVKCTEDKLVDALIVLRAKRQENCTQSRRDYLTKRLLVELAELMVEKQPSDDDNSGRLSGSLEWRQARGEINEESNLFVWQILDEHIIDNNRSIIIKYSVASNCYVYELGNGRCAIINDWHSGIFSQSNLYRKVENDWKIAYLARQEGTDVGTIKWQYELKTTTSYTIDKIYVKFRCNTYENGEINVKITTLNDDNTVSLLKSTDGFVEIDSFVGCKSFSIVATLSGGKGDVAWQHAQLFRQSTSDVNSKDDAAYPFCVKIVFK